jgi:glucose/arabinose dehydrogenase
MLKQYFLPLFLGALFAGKAYTANAQGTVAVGNTTLTVRNVISTLNVPWEIIWGPDNFIWMTEREGIISRLNPQTGQKNIILDIQSSVYSQSESGMLGLALHPDFPTTPYLYTVYTYAVSGNVKEKVVRYTYNGTTLVAPMTLLDGINGNSTHAGARLYILPDNTMLVTTGDYQNQPSAQDLTSLNGKILRLNLDGSIPADNPFPNSYVWSFGHRNAQGVLLHPNGNLYISEHGPTSDDEFMIAKKGRNHGWPTVAGFCDDAVLEAPFCTQNNVVEPLKAWTPTIAPSDIFYYNHPAIPEFQNTILMTVLKDKMLTRLTLNAAGDSVTNTTNFFTNQFQRLRDICMSPDGTLYLATNGANWSNTDPNTHKIVELKNNAFVANHSISTDNTKTILVANNPVVSGGKIQLLPNFEGSYSVVLYDAFGKEIQRLQGSGNINLTAPTIGGLYFYTIQADKWQQSGKIVVE